MQSSQINHQHIIDVHPHIIITSKRENLTTTISKAEMSLKTIPVVVISWGILAVWTVVLPSKIIEREEGSIRIFVQSRGISGEGESELASLCLSGIVEPVVKRSGRLNVFSWASAGVCVDGGTISSNTSTLINTKSVGWVTFLSHQAFLVVGVVVEGQLEVGTHKSIGIIGRTSGTAKLHKIRSLVAKYSL